jgi:glycosyltransferase involved in cell wall biosynthesis
MPTDALGDTNALDPTRMNFMTRSPLLSVIIPNYNYSRFVGAAIESALRLDCEEKEIVVVDDGSTDDSLCVIRKFVESPTVRLISKRNTGQPDSINRAFQETRGSIIYILDADDMVYPRMLREVLPHWGDGVSKIQFALDVVNADGDPAGWSMCFPRRLHPSEVRRHLLRSGAYPCTPTSGGVFSRAFVEKIFPLEKNLWADAALSTLAPLYGNVVTITRALAQYRVHDANDSATNRFDLRARQRAVRERVLRDDLLRRHCEKLGIAIAPKLRDRDIGDLRERLLSLKLDKHHHPIAEDHLFVLVLRGLFAQLTDPWIKPALKPLWVAWLIAVAVGPRSVVTRLAVTYYVKTARPKLGVALVRLLGGAKGSVRRSPPVTGVARRGRS